jgi:hypothetical protein
MGVHLSNNQIPNRNKMTASLHPPDDKPHLAQTEFEFVMLEDKRHAMQLATVDMHGASRPPFHAIYCFCSPIFDGITRKEADRDRRRVLPTSL